MVTGEVNADIVSYLVDQILAGNRSEALSYLQEVRDEHRAIPVTLSSQILECLREHVLLSLDAAIDTFYVNGNVNEKAINIIRIFTRPSKDWIDVELDILKACDTIGFSSPVEENIF
ncbi:hypothetical protein LCGC14_2439180 [marine sediment metagenome]|uniref:Uncharacterized protein n=1 Tax=marine sediment metagenome TaxID=412755 RepID=A0A0F9BJJ3_9ZZZZ